MPPARFIRRPVEVDAVQWLGESNCVEVFDFLGWEHPEDELDHSLIYVDDGEAKPGDWIVRTPDGEHVAVPADRFAAIYEPATP
jgi:coenzyme F420-reducing hydrogenase beta subunit